MRDKPPPVPLVIAESGYKDPCFAAPTDRSEGNRGWMFTSLRLTQAHLAGFIQVPWDFTVDGLCDILEESWLQLWLNVERN